MDSYKRIPFAAETILGSSILLGFAVAILSPTNILSQSPVLASFTDFIASLIPGIDKLAKVSQFPEVTRLTSAVLWASVPLQVAVSMLPGVYVLPLSVIERNKSRSLFFWLVTPLMAFLLVFVPFRELTPDQLLKSDIYHWGLRNVTESRIWLGVLGGMVVYTAAAFIFGFLTFWFRASTVYFKPNN